jgi:hypothetical protein
VLERHAIMVLVSMKVHRTDANVIEVMKVQHVIDKSIYVQILFVTMEVYVLSKRIINLCVNVHMVIEDRIVMNLMVCVYIYEQARVCICECCVILFDEMIERKKKERISLRKKQNA